MHSYHLTFGELLELAQRVKKLTIEKCCGHLCLECAAGKPVERCKDTIGWVHPPNLLCTARRLRELLFVQEEREDANTDAGNAVSGLLSADRRRASA